MGSRAVRIDKESHLILKEIRGQEDVSAQEIIHKALEDYRRKLFLNRLGKAYSLLKSDKKAWDKEISERDAWDAAIGDDLKKDN